MIQFNFLKLSIILFTSSLTLHQVAVFEISRNITIRLSELFFLFLLLIFLFNFIKKKIIIKFSNLDFLILLFPIYSFIHLLLFRDGSSVLGFLISIYSFLIYFIFKTYLINFKKNDLDKILIFIALIASLLSIVGWILVQLNINNLMVLTYDYPISIGKAGRSRALFETPNSLFFFLVFPTLIVLDKLNYLDKKQYGIILFIVLLGSFLTFSKSNVLLFAVILFYYAYNKFFKNYKNIIYVLALFLIAIYLFFSHFLILNINSKNFIKYTSTWFVSETYEPVIEYKHYVVIPTNYIETKKKNLELFYKNPFLGNGFNSYTNFKSAQVPHENGKPHSTYFGYLSEYGIIGFLLISLIFGYVAATNWSKKNHGYYLFVFSIYIIFESLNADLMTSRIIWIFFAYSEFTSINTLNDQLNEAKKIYTS